MCGETELSHLKFHVDVLQWNSVSGWLFAPDRRHLIQVWRGADCVASVLPNGERADVAAHFPDVKEALRCGFRTSLTLPDDGEGFALRVTACEIDANGEPVGGLAEIGQRRVMGPKAIRASFASRENREADASLSAFPNGVEAAVCNIWPEVKPAGGDAAAQRVVAARVKELFARTARVAAPTELTDYIRFLTAINAHFRFVTQYFPSMNDGRSAEAKDLCATPNSAREMLSIANHLFVVKSHGVAGDFAEFGCFKGFSSSMLSYACSLLGLKMHIFDSFQGLPPSQSAYYKAGDFCGSLDEVRRNVSQFGAVDCVQFHPGYFNDSVPRDRNDIGRLATLWMDVDLYDSARGVMGIFDKLDARGAIFSHECGPRSFDGDRILPYGISPEQPLPAIVDGYGAAGVDPAGRHVFGATGAFWSRRDGFPVLDSAALMDIVAAL
jgi:hypothetical protein